MYKLIFSDLDETLLVEHHVPEFNRIAIKKAQDKGVKFIVATGRAYNMIFDILKEIGTYEKENEYSICFNGALIIENKNRRILRFKGIDFENVKELLSRAKKYDVCVLVFTLDMCYIFNPSEDEIKRKTIQKAKFKVIDDFQFEFLQDQQVAKILYQNTNLEYLKKIAQELEDCTKEKISVSYSSNRYMEFNAWNINKGNALNWLANYLGVKLEDTIAIGDNYNDLQMLQTAKLGACVSSSSDDIKAVANYVTKLDYHEGAVKEVIEKFILEDM